MHNLYDALDKSIWNMLCSSTSWTAPECPVFPRSLSPSLGWSLPCQLTPTSGGWVTCFTKHCDILTFTGHLLSHPQKIPNTIIRLLLYCYNYQVVCVFWWNRGTLCLSVPFSWLLCPSPLSLPTGHAGWQRDLFQWVPSSRPTLGHDLAVDSWRSISDGVLQHLWPRSGPDRAG